MMLTLLLASLVLSGAQGDVVQPIEITIQRTVCYGTCPDYEVTLRGDGTVRYTGRQYVRITGTHSWKVDPAAVRALAREMEQAGYFELKDEYTAMITDNPTTWTTLTIGPRTKKIKDYFAGPKKLKELQQRIDEVAGVKKYVFITGEAIREMQKTGWRASGDDARDWMRRAIYAADTDVVGALLGAGFDAKAADASGVTLVMLAAEIGHAETVRLLLKAGADPAARDRSGRNAADRARDGLRSGAPRDYALILKLLTDE